MSLLIHCVRAFLCGGGLCLIGQLLLDKTSLTPARILVLYVVSGVVLGGAGLYQPLIRWAGAGAAVPLTGFGCLLARGAALAVSEDGLMGAFTGGLSAAAGGVTAAIAAGVIISFFFRSKPKS